MVRRKNLVGKNLQIKGRLIFFNEEQHKYTDDLGNPYISVTTLIHKYVNEFDKEAIAKACEKIGKNPAHKDYLKYKDKTAKQILKEWDDETKRACNKGTIKHNFLEQAVKKSSGYKIDDNGFIQDQIYTIDNIIQKHRFGKLNLDYFIKTGIKDKYPTIFQVIEHFVNKGYNIYSEIGVYSFQYLVSGLIDILLVKDTDFVILDWKTNKAPIRFEAGYYKKDINGNLLLDQYVVKDDVFKHPLTNLADSVGNHYTMQLSTYAYLVETFGFTCKGLILCHIRTVQNNELDFNKDGEFKEQEEVKFHKIEYLKDSVEAMLGDYAYNNINKTTLTLF